MYINFDVPEIPTSLKVFSEYWDCSLFMRAPSTRYQINALANTYVRLVSAALVEYGEGSKRLREFWSTHSSFNLGAMHRSISHFESCIFNVNRATNCFRRLRGDRLNDPIAVALRQERVAFAQNEVADRIRVMRNEIHHLEDSVIEGLVTEGQSFALRPDGPEVAHPTEENQTIKTVDRLVIGEHEVAFGELVQWLFEMANVIPRIVEALPNASSPSLAPNAT